MALKNRSEIDSAFQWKLEDIYPSVEAWETAWNSAARQIAQLSDLPGTLSTSPDSLKAGLDRIYDAMRPVTLLYAYASLLKSGDNGDAEAQRLCGMAVNLDAQFNAAVSFMNPEILTIPSDVLHSWMQLPSLAEYRHILDDIDRLRPYTLSAEQELLLSRLTDAASTPDEIFTMLSSVDFTFPDITGEDGNPATLTHGTYGVYLRSRNRTVRKEAFETYLGEFNRYLNTIAATYAGAVKLDDFFAISRGYDSALHESLFASNVPVSVYDSLIEAIHSGLPIMQRYLRLRKQVLRLESLHMYDLYTPIVDSIEYHLDLDSCKELVKHALEPLGADYQKLLNKAFEENWMDIYENKGKTTGAFSYGVHGVHPYVLLNFTGTLDDAYTMAHELGHAMHSWFSSANNSFANHSYRLLVAEVASTVNEVLLTRYLLRTETDPRRRAYLLNKLLESFRTTVFRQTLFAEFERKAHDAYHNGEPLTAELMNGMYRELNEQYYSECEVDALQDTEWARIPHFYSAFYVYQYATGFCSAVAIADHICETGYSADYLHFLTTGDSDYPIEELKIAGVDLTSPEVVTRALKVFDETLQELEQLLPGLTEDK